MPRIDLVVESEVSKSVRVRQLSAMFDVPPQAKCSVRIKGNLPLDKQPWNVGLIVGPSGAGKSTIAHQLWPDSVSPSLDWPGKSVIDDFAGEKSIEDIAGVCKAVGFNTIPAWLRPYSVLSTGEKFRVDLARRLLELPDPIVVDEFTSVVDRQVAAIGAHAVQKFARAHQRQFVAVTCHYDVTDWLQPDWIFEPATSEFQWRCLQPRPQLQGEIARVDKAAWRLFAPYHYMSAELHKAANCFCLFVDGRPVSFAAVIHRPHPKAKNIKGISRAVTLPDWQGLGLIFRLQDALGAAYRGLGYRLHHCPAHPKFIHSMDRSPCWALIRRPATFVPTGRTSTLGAQRITGEGDGDKAVAAVKKRAGGSQGMWPCATFRYVGPPMDRGQAMQLTGQIPAGRVA